MIKTICKLNFHEVSNAQSAQGVLIVKGRWKDSENVISEEILIERGWYFKYHHRNLNHLKLVIF